MGFFDRLFGRSEVSPEPTRQGSQTPVPQVPAPMQQQVSQAPVRRSGAVTAYPPVRRPTGTASPQDSTAPQGSTNPQDSSTGATPEDQAAIARYRYLLRTAPPERVEQVHAEAFARLTPHQRQAVLAEMTRTLPPEEVPPDEPQAMARAATRAELAHPGYLQRAFGAGPGLGGTGFGGTVGGSMLGTIAGVVVGSALAQALLGGFEQSPEAAQYAGAPDAGAGGTGAVETDAVDESAVSADPGADAAVDEHAWADELAWGDVRADFGTDLDGFGGGGASF